jgi:hypothetical protein
MDNDILQIINFLFLIGVVAGIYILVRNSGKSAEALGKLWKIWQKTYANW